jgi:hypothetical protein
LHDLPDYLIMPKRKDAIGGATEDVDSVTSMKKAKVQKLQDQKLPVAMQKGTLVESINALSMEDFHSRFVDENILEYQSTRAESTSDFQISLVAADWLAPGEYNAAFNLIEGTSRADYESSTFGGERERRCWDPI